jgi:hypothetical protein
LGIRSSEIQNNQTKPNQTIGNLYSKRDNLPSLQDQQGMKKKREFQSRQEQTSRQKKKNKSKFMEPQTYERGTGSSWLKRTQAAETFLFLFFLCCCL